MLVLVVIAVVDVLVMVFPHRGIFSFVNFSEKSLFLKVTLFCESVIRAGDLPVDFCHLASLLICKGVIVAVEV